MRLVKKTGGAAKLEEAEKALCIVMLASVDHPAMCWQLGIEVHTSIEAIKSPLLWRALHAAMRVWDGQEVTSKDGDGNLKEVNCEGVLIIVAEEIMVNQPVTVTLPQKWGHTTVPTCNGQEAVEKAAEEEFDLVVMDVRELPGSDACSLSEAVSCSPCFSPGLLVLEGANTCARRVTSHEQDKGRTAARNPVLECQL